MKPYNNSNFQENIDEITDALRSLSKDYGVKNNKVFNYLTNYHNFVLSYSVFNRIINGKYDSYKSSPYLLKDVYEGINELLNSPKVIETLRSKKTEYPYLLREEGWWLYHYNDNSKFIARSTLHLTSDGTVKIINPNNTNEIEEYEGKFTINGRLLMITIPGKNNFKDLSIFLQLNMSNEPSIILGQYISSNVNSNIVSGAVIIERIINSDNKASLKPSSFSNKGEDREEYIKTVNKSIRRYFCSKELNFQKTPKKPIYNHSTLNEFIDNYKHKGDGILNHKYDFFISAPIFSCEDYDEYLKIRTNILKICKVLIKKDKSCRIKYLGKDKIPEELYRTIQTKRISETETDHYAEDLIKSKHHLVFLPNNQFSTGSFIEIGISLRSNKPMTIFYKDIKTLPYMLSKLMHKSHDFLISLREYSNFNSLIKSIDKEGIHKFLPSHS